MLEFLNTPISRELALFLGLAPVALVGIAYLVHVIRAAKRIEMRKRYKSDKE